jgi:hypothetical protein
LSKELTHHFALALALTKNIDKADKLRLTRQCAKSKLDPIAFIAANGVDL